MNTNKKLCVCISNPSFSVSYETAKQSDFVEIRLDLVAFNNDELLKLFDLDCSIIATCRYGSINDQERTTILKHAVDLGADYVDLEIDASASFVSEMMAYANSKGCKIILSYHNFNETPEYSILKNIIDIASQKEADYIKIATQINTQSDLSRIMSLYEEHKNLIAFGMGDLGKVSRVSSLFLGAEFTYVSSTKAEETAAGQLTLSEIQKIIDIL